MSGRSSPSPWRRHLPRPGLDPDQAPAGDLRDLRIELPPGLLLNPAMPHSPLASTCATAAFNTPRISPFTESRSGESCPLASQVGTVEVQTAEETRRFGLFNLKAPAGVPARLDQGEGPGC